MKKLIIISAIAIGLSLPLITSAQTPPHPGGTGGGAGTTPVGGTPVGAPIGSGTVILTILAAAYSGKKVYNLRNEE